MNVGPDQDLTASLLGCSSFIETSVICFDYHGHLPASDRMVVHRFSVEDQGSAGVEPWVKACCLAALNLCRFDVERADKALELIADPTYSAAILHLLSRLPDRVIRARLLEAVPFNRTQLERTDALCRMYCPTGPLADTFAARVTIDGMGEAVYTIYGAPSDLRLFRDGLAAAPEPDRPYFAVLGNPKYAIASQLMEIFELALKNPMELNWDCFNSLKRVLKGIMTMANSNSPDMFPDIEDPVLRRRMYNKLLNETCALNQTRVAPKYNELISQALEQYGPQEFKPAKRAKGPTDDELLKNGLGGEFKTLVPYQEVKLNQAPKASDGKPGTFLHLYRRATDRRIERLLRGKTFWEYF